MSTQDISAITKAMMVTCIPEKYDWLINQLYCETTKHMLRNSMIIMIELKQILGHSLSKEDMHFKKCASDIYSEDVLQRVRNIPKADAIELGSGLYMCQLSLIDDSIEFDALEKRLIKSALTTCFKADILSDNKAV